jgi:hypothetical protein
VPDLYDAFPSTEIEVRVYVVKTLQMTPLKDDGGGGQESFVRLIVGDKVVNGDDVIGEGLNPKFYACFRVRVRLPGGGGGDVLLTF